MKAFSLSNLGFIKGLSTKGRFTKRRPLQDRPPVIKDVVFIGGGHAHAVAIKMLSMVKIPGVRFTLISNAVQTPYSGMLPGLIAGHYDFDQTHVDLGRLCRACDVRFIEDTVVGLDTESQTIQCKQHPAFSYDILSIDTGSTPDLKAVPGAQEYTQGVKPVPQFLAYWQALQGRVQAQQERAAKNSQPTAPLRIGAVGGGASAVEVLLAMQHRLKRQLEQQSGVTLDNIEFHLVSATEQILPSHNDKVRSKYVKVLKQRGIHIHSAFRVTAIESVNENATAEELSEGKSAEKKLISSNGDELCLDEVIWTTAAQAARWPKKAGLSCSERGFIEVNDALQTLSHDNVFATGDVADMVNHPRPKAGVFAVRQGKPLAENILRLLQGKATKSFRPQDKFLSLVSTGDCYAVASRGNWALSGRWVWRWKDHIDQKFMRQLNTLALADMGTGTMLSLATESADGVSDLPPMRCGGCGAKVGQPVLQRVISQLKTCQSALVQLGLNAPDDAAVLSVPAGKQMVQSVDAFRSMIDDDYLFGQIAANHALGDVFAMGAEPHSAQAIVTLPYASEIKVEQQLLHVMQGATKIFNQCGMSLVGGHTAEGAELSLGFVVNGLAEPDDLLRKSGLKIGDKLILTKPLGTGTLFAADMRAQAHGVWIKQAVQSMIQLNQTAALCLIENGAKACTDVTGFGLIGHLYEMLEASSVSAEVSIDKLPLLEGATASIQAGIVSTLQGQNEKISRTISNYETMRISTDLAILFDPQTAGGLIAGVASENSEACVKALRALGYGHACVIGQVGPSLNGQNSIILT